MDAIVVHGGAGTESSPWQVLQLAKEQLDECRADRSPRRASLGRWFLGQADGREGDTHVSLIEHEVVELDVPRTVLDDYVTAGQVLMRVVNEALERLDQDLLGHALSHRDRHAPEPDWAAIAREAEDARRRRYPPG